MTGCISPTPHIVSLNKVANMLGILNPTGSAVWAGSPVKYMHGILALEPLVQASLPGPSPALPDASPAIPDSLGISSHEMAGKRHTTSLHFQLTRHLTATGLPVPGVTVKSSWDATWSEPHFMFKESPSGLSFETPPYMAYKYIPDTRLREIQAGLDASARRLTPEQNAANQDEYDSLATPLRVPFHWEDGGRFACEHALRRMHIDHLDFDYSGSEEEQDFSGGEGGEAGDDAAGRQAVLEDAVRARVIDSIPMPPENCITNHRGMVVRQQARKSGTYQPVQTNVVINCVVAFAIKWEGDGERQDFYLGRVQKLERNGSDKIVTVSYMHAPKMFGTYKPWRGSGRVMTIPGQDILLAREKARFLTTAGLIRTKLQDKIRANLLTWQQGNVCMEAVSAAEDSEVEAEAEDCQDLDRRDSASESDSDARLSSQSLSKKKKKQKQTKKDKKGQKKNKKSKRRKKK